MLKRPPSVAETATSSRAPTPLADESRQDADTRAMPPPSVPSHRAGSPATARPAVQRSISSALSPVLQGEQGEALRAPTPDRESAATSFAQKRELEELRIKIRILESRRTEDQERIKSLESKAGEADALRAARVKLQCQLLAPLPAVQLTCLAKFHEIQSSLVAAQRSSKDLQSENTHLESRTAEAMDQLEMAALDREVAEEKAEAAESEVQKLTEKVEELEMEIAVLKEENGQLPNPDHWEIIELMDLEVYERPAGTEGERSSLAFVQLEKHNERLKEALIRSATVSRFQFTS